MSDQMPPPQNDGAAGFMSNAWGRFRSWPIWAQGAIGFVLAVIVIAAVTGDDDEEPVEAVATTTTVPSFDEIASTVDVSFMDDDEFAALLEDACEAMESSDTDEAAEEIHASMDEDLTEDEARELADAIAEAAPATCPDQVADHPQFLNAFVSATPTTTTTTTTTTAPPTTTTTAPPPPPTTAAPPPPPPPPPPEESSGGGDTYYKNCDEARAAGAAPMHRGEPGYREGLDRDKDGIACDK